MAMLKGNHSHPHEVTPSNPPSNSNICVRSVNIVDHIIMICLEYKGRSGGIC